MIMQEEAVNWGQSLIGHRKDRKEDRKGRSDAIIF